MVELADDELVSDFEVDAELLRLDFLISPSDKLSIIFTWLSSISGIKLSLASRIAIFSLIGLVKFSLEG